MKPAPYKSSELFTTLNNHQVGLTNLIFCIVNMVVAIFILILNGLVLDTMIRQGKSREPADLLVAGLALTDLMLGLLIIWVTVYTVVYFQDVHECLTRLGLAHAIILTGMLLLLCLTADRFLRIFYSLRYNVICEKWTVWVVMAAAFMAGIVIGILPILGWNGSGKRKPGESICWFFVIMDENYLRLFLVLIAAIIILIFLLYFKLFLLANKHAVAIRTKSISSETSSKNRAWMDRKSCQVDHAWRYTKTVLLIVGVNCAFWLPMGIVVSCSITGAFDDISKDVQGDFVLYTSTLVYCNSLLNPLIYAIKITAIRRRFMAVFCQRCRKPDDILSPGSRNQLSRASLKHSTTTDTQIADLLLARTAGTHETQSLQRVNSVVNIASSSNVFDTIDQNRRAKESKSDVQLSRKVSSRLAMPASSWTDVDKNDKNVVKAASSGELQRSKERSTVRFNESQTMRDN